MTMDNFWQYFFGFLTALGTGALAILGQWVLNRQQTKTLEEKVDKVGSKVATTVTGSQAKIQATMTTSGEEVKQEVRDFANGGPNGLKAQVRQVLQEFVAPNHLEDTEQSCPLMRAIAKSYQKPKSTMYDKETDVVHPPIKEKQ